VGPRRAGGDTRVGLVLGGGGLVGQAYHAGVLAAIEHDTGWDPGTADVIVGTSAGAVTGLLLRAGLRTAELASFYTARSRQHRFGRRAPTLELDPLDWPALLRPRWPSPGVVARVARAATWRRPTVAGSMLVADGSRDASSQLAFLDELDLGDAHGGWPAGDLRVVAVAQRDGRRVVMGPPTRPGTAVAASCAVPGYFRAVEIEGEHYVDGGVYSPTNADVLVGESLDLVVVVAPMAARTNARAGIDWLVRRLASVYLAGEVRQLVRDGADVLVVNPSRDAVAAMGHDLMRRDACPDTVREAFLDVGRRWAEGARRFRSRLAGEPVQVGAQPSSVSSVPYSTR
jgi:NTE family protein